MTWDYVITSLIVVIAPGTGVIYTLAIALGRGSRASIIAALGCTFGIVPHMLAAILGLAAVMHTSALAFQLLKYAGIAYLLYMAWSTLRQQGVLQVEPSGDIGSHVSSQWQILISGFALNILNPKLSIFFLAFLPQFISVGEGQPALVMLKLSALFMALTFFVFVLYGLAAAAVRRHVIASPAAMNWMRRIFAGAFVALGARLALAER